MSKDTSHKQARAGGKFCRVPDGYMHKDRVISIMHDNYKSGHDIGYEVGKESGIVTGVFFGALGMFVVGVFMLYVAV